MPTFTFWDPGSCNCGCQVTFTIKGCSGLAYQGVTVNTYTSSGGTLLGSGVTNSAGQVTIPAQAGNTWVTITGASTRFVSYAQTLNLTCPGSQTITLTVASGYVCAFNCVLPISTTLHGTFTATTPPPGPGTSTLTWNGTLWQSTPFTTGSGCIQITTGGYLCQGTVLAGICNCCMNDAYASVTCPPSFQLVWNLNPGSMTGCALPAWDKAVYTE